MATDMASEPRSWLKLKGSSCIESLDTIAPARHKEESCMAAGASWELPVQGGAGPATL